eukprot:1147222-Pelagomonas_calceolata.AAC.1
MLAWSSVGASTVSALSQTLLESIPMPQARSMANRMVFEDFLKDSEFSWRPAGKQTVLTQESASQSLLVCQVREGG